MTNAQAQKADFRIDTNGNWFHEGAPIKRAALAKLFSDRALKVDEDGNYWLQTPYEKYPVDVEDVPYVIVNYEDLTLITNMDERIELNENTNWELRSGIPYVEIRKGLFAKISRSVLYNLIEEFGECIKIKDRDRSFPLG